MNLSAAFIASAVLAGLLAGCQQTAAPRPDLTLCEEPRPEVCTREYLPVCGYLPAADAWNTYGNDCTACADEGVEGWKAGACVEAQ